MCPILERGRCPLGQPSPVAAPAHSQKNILAKQATDTQHACIPAAMHTCTQAHGGCAHLLAVGCPAFAIFDMLTPNTVQGVARALPHSGQVLVYYFIRALARFISLLGRAAEHCHQSSCTIQLLHALFLCQGIIPIDVSNRMRELGSTAADEASRWCCRVCEECRMTHEPERVEMAAACVL